MALDLKEVDIIVHVWKREKLQSELYVVNLGTGRLSRLHGRGVDREDASCAMVASGDLIYLVGNSRPFDPTKARSPSDMLNYGYPRFSPDRPRTRAGWSFDLTKMMNAWKEVPNYKSLSHHPRSMCFSQGQYLSIWRRYSRDQRWTPLELIPWGGVPPSPQMLEGIASPTTTRRRPRPRPKLRRPIADHDNNRLLVHFTHIDFLYAYYPDDLKWVRLFPFPASSWDFVSVVVDGIILIHDPDPDNDTHFVAFDLTHGKWLNPSVSVSVPDFNYNLLYWEYDALFPLTPPATFCLAKNLQFLIFTVVRSSSGDPLITVSSTVSLQLDLPPVVYNYLPMGERQARLWKRHLKRSEHLLSEILKFPEKCRARNSCK